MIAFNDRDWERIKTTYRKWRKGELQRPVLPCAFWGREPRRDKPPAALLSYVNSTDLSISPEQIVDRYDYELSCCEFVGDSFPCMQMSQFGPGVMAAFLGAEPVPSEHTVWFRPERAVPVEDLHFTYDPDNLWLRRIKDIYRAGMKKWRGGVVMAMTDLGGILDVLAVFCSTENLLYDLYDKPAEVGRLVGELSETWLACFREINEILAGSQGYTDWAGILYEDPSYMLQSDFSYMISSEMFREFVKEELRGKARSMGGAFYHLDGEGELRHLNDLLEIEEIYGIQWIPGEGSARERDWSELYARIGAAGKKLQLPYGLDFYLDEAVAALPSPDLLIKMQTVYPMREKPRILAKLHAYGAE